MATTLLGLPRAVGQSEEGQECLSASAAIPTTCPHLSNLWEVAVGPGAATEALLVAQAVVEGRLHHMACVDLVHRDVVLLRQAAHQVLRVAHELGLGRGYRGCSAPAGQARKAHPTGWWVGPDHPVSGPALYTHQEQKRHLEGRLCSGYRDGTSMHLLKAGPFYSVLETSHAPSSLKTRNLKACEKC